MKKGQRQSNFELIRIIAMLLIIVHHSLVHGALLGSASIILKKSNPLTFGLFNFVAIGGKVGVYLYILITGYFMLKSEVSFKKIVRLWLPIFFWSVVLTLIGGGVITHKLTVIGLIKSIFPIIFNQYWFMSVYFFMYLLAPLLNQMILAIDINEELLLVFIGLAVIFPANHFYGEVTYSWLICFCFVYCFGGLIRKHNLISRNWFKTLTNILFWLSTFTNVLVSFGFSFLGFKFHKGFFIKHNDLLVNGETIICLFIAISIFTWIGSKNIGYSKFVNNIAATTFGVYLIHDNIFVRSLIWNDLLHMRLMAFQPAYVIFYILLLCVLIFTICSLLEFIRMLVFSNFEIGFATLLDSARNKVFKKFNQVLKSVNSKKKD